MANIVLVDDSNFLKNLLSNMIKRIGHNVVGLGKDGKEAIELYKKLKPDIIFLDITMPVLNGLEASKQILDYDKNANIVICSAMGQKFMILDAINIGVKDFVVKPFEEKKIKEIIDKILKK